LIYAAAEALHEVFIRDALEAVDKTATGDYRGAVVSATLTVFKPAKVFDKFEGILIRDATGKVHGVLPKIADLKRDMPTDKIKEAIEELRASILTRKQELERLGEHASHRARIGEEEALLRSLEGRLEDIFGAKNGF